MLIYHLSFSFRKYYQNYSVKMLYKIFGNRTFYFSICGVTSAFVGSFILSLMRKSHVWTQSQYLEVFFEGFFYSMSEFIADFTLLINKFSTLFTDRVPPIRLDFLSFNTRKKEKNNNNYNMQEN